MQGNLRREKILDLLNNESKEIKAINLANMFNCSRQVIVNDIALLRALGYKIKATNNGYILDNLNDYKSHQVLVKHSIKDTKKELKELVKCNIIIYDTIINHPIYGIIKGELNIKTLKDVNDFINKKSNLLSSITDGVHIHTLLYKDEKDLRKALDVLSKLGFIYND